ncbi:MAG: hypothetical protein JNM90_18715 [Burkholderiales bacterium]|nr:hypothetical protein [Burkholderiales bacterium]
MSFDAVIVVGLILAVLVVIVLLARKRAGAPRGSGARAEAYFKAMFPDLQPHFHPEKAARFVRARNARGTVADGDAWRAPPGFATASAVIALASGRERIRLRGERDDTLAEFGYRRQADGGELLIGAGTMTVNLAETGNPRVRYRHPEREFDWSLRGGWRFMTPVAERAIEPDDQGSRFSRDSDRSSPSSGTTAAVVAGGAAAALVSGAGGAFDGGGASGDWDDGNAEAADAASADAGGSTTAY